MSAELARSVVRRGASRSLRHRSLLAMALALTATFAVVEVTAGFLTGSLVLLADAGHMFADVTGLTLALLAVWFAQRPADQRRTYGYYRTEILAALVNALLLSAVGAYIVYEAWQRFRDPVDIAAAPVLIVATLGLGVNVVAARLLHAAAAESLNVRAAFLEVTAEMLGSVGAIAAAIIVLTTGWRYADPVFALAVGAFIVPRAWRILRSAVEVLLEGAPADVAMADVQAAVLGVPGVRSVHDLHVWTVTSGFVALSGHVNVGDGVDRDATLLELQRALAERFGIEHVTIQIENDRLSRELDQPCLPGDVPCYADDAQVDEAAMPPARAR
jgi:cobalt-zinc-cadmium efflux system protein